MFSKVLLNRPLCDLTYKGRLKHESSSDSNEDQEESDQPKADRPICEDQETSAQSPNPESSPDDFAVTIELRDVQACRRRGYRLRTYKRQL